MKINKQQLKQLIMEEMNAMLSEQEYEWPSWDPRQPGGAKPSPFVKSMTPRDQEDFETIKAHVRSPDVNFLMRKDIESRPDWVGPPSTLPQIQKRIRAGQEAASQAKTSALEKSLGVGGGGDPFDRPKIERPPFERGGGFEMDMPEGFEMDMPDFNREDVAYQRDPVPWVTNLTPKERDITVSDLFAAERATKAGVSRPEFRQALEDWYFSQIDPLVLQGAEGMGAGAEAMERSLNPPSPHVDPRYFHVPSPYLEESCKKKSKKLTITVGKKRKP